MLRFDANECTECQACLLKCSFVKETEYNPAKARLRIVGRWPEQPKMKICRQCQEPACVLACPVGAISQTAGGAICVDYDTCSQCGLCAEACPYAAVHTYAGKILICDTCKGEFPCAGVCSTGALARERSEEDV